MAKLSIGSPLQLAEKLFKIRSEIEAFMEPVEKLKVKEEKLRTEMLESLKANKMDSLKTERGINYVRADKPMKFIIKDKEKALAWAIENHCAKIDVTETKAKLAGTGALPDFFEEEYQGQTLRIEGMKNAL